MTVHVNGRPQEVEPGTTLLRLLEALGVPPDGVAVATGREVVPRSRLGEHLLVDGERIEILRAVGGG